METRQPSDVELFSTLTKEEKELIRLKGLLKECKEVLEIAEQVHDKDEWDGHCLCFCNACKAKKLLEKL